jgi:hypothetical protein
MSIILTWIFRRRHRRPPPPGQQQQQDNGPLRTALSSPRDLKNPIEVYIDEVLIETIHGPFVRSHLNLDSGDGFCFFNRHQGPEESALLHLLVKIGPFTSAAEFNAFDPYYDATLPVTNRNGGSLSNLLFVPLPLLGLPFAF